MNNIKNSFSDIEKLNKRLDIPRIKKQILSLISNSTSPHLFFYSSKFSIKKSESKNKIAAGHKTNLDFYRVSNFFLMPLHKYQSISELYQSNSKVQAIMSIFFTLSREDSFIGSYKVSKSSLS